MRVFTLSYHAGHGTNVDGLWLRPNAPKVLSVGSTVLFGGSTRTYKVRSACFVLQCSQCMPYLSPLPSSVCSFQAR